MALDGIEIFCNSSASHHELRKSAYQLNMLMRAAVQKVLKLELFSLATAVHSSIVSCLVRWVGFICTRISVDATVTGSTVMGTRRSLRMAT